jgi:hypothetical protein
MNNLENIENIEDIRNIENISYNPTEEEILTLQKQIEINDKYANLLLKKNYGDLYLSVEDAFKLSEGDTSVLKPTNNKITLNNETLGIENDNDIGIILEKCRYILDEKDNIYINSKNYKHNINKDIFYSIKFNYNTKVFIKERFETDRNTIVEKIARNYLENEFPDINLKNSIKNISHNIIKQEIYNNSSLAEKWQLNNAILCLLNLQIVNDTNNTNNINEEYKNNIITKYLKKNKIIKQNQYIIGPCFIIDQWTK